MINTKDIHQEADPSKADLFDIDPFDIMLEDFLGLEELEKDAILKYAAAAAKPFALIFFRRNICADWVAIAHAPNNVVAFGDMNDYPSVEKIDKMTDGERVTLHIFERPMKSKRTH